METRSGQSWLSNNYFTVSDEDEYISEKTDRFGGHFEGWSDEDVIKAYILQELRKQELNTNKYLQPMHPMFTSSSQLAGY